jgi:hypothetical protein
MWKKAGWIYVGLYILGYVYIMISSTLKEIQAGQFDAITLLISLIFLIPAGVLAINLKGKKVSILFTLLALLITVAPVAAILNFNNFDLTTIGKTLVFLPMITGLIFFGYIKLFKK